MQQATAAVENMRIEAVCPKEESLMESKGGTPASPFGSLPREQENRPSNADLRLGRSIGGNNSKVTTGYRGEQTIR